MPPLSKPFQRSVRIASVLGLSALSLTQEIGTAYLVFAWAALISSVAADRYPERQRSLQKFETAAVLGWILWFIIDMAVFHQTFFIAMAHFLILFQAFKWLGFKARKDGLQILFFAFFQILSACTLAAGVWDAVIFLALIPVGTMGLFWNHLDEQLERAGQTLPPHFQRSSQKMARAMAGFAVPMNIILTAFVFILFPRLTLNATLPGFANQHMGFTDQVDLRRTGTIADDPSVVMWMRLSASDRPLWSGYLRGLAMTRFDGQQWRANPTEAARPVGRDGNGVFRPMQPLPGAQLIHPAILLVSPSAGTLFITGRPLEVITTLPSLELTRSSGLRSTTRWDHPLRYDFISDVAMRRVLPGSLLPPSERQELLKLPGIPLDRIAARAKEAARHGSAYERAQHIAAYLRTRCRYSADLGAQRSDNPVETFLETSRSGPCGHFASAMALMCRLQGIPSRVVAGYWHGEYNAPADQFVIREQDAHAWVEAYVDGLGWVPFDPSPRQSLSPGAAQQSWRHEVRQYWDYLGFQWDRLIIEYDLYSQIKALQTLQHSSETANTAFSRWWQRHFANLSRSKPQSRGEEPALHSSGRLSRPWTAALLLASLGAASFFWKRKARTPEDQAVLAYRRFLSWIARQGFPKKPSETAREFFKRLREERPAHAPRAHDVTERYYAARFGTSGGGVR
jgi:protein-glutamine gamma-glutamyltransferase